MDRLQAALDAGKSAVEVNVWRPGDLVATDQVFPDRVEEIGRSPSSSSE